MSFLFTSESVTGGHPDKLADQISDAVLDAYLAKDARARVAIETYVTNGLCLVGGEVRARPGVHVDVAAVARETMRAAGYGDPACGFPADDVAVLVAVGEQSPDIAQGVDRGDEALQGAGDQGLMFGFACKDTPELMPLPIHLAHRLSRELTRLRTSGVLPYLLPDGKTQVTVEYGDDGRPVRLESVVVSTQHRKEVRDVQRIRADLEKHLFPVALAPWKVDARTKVHVNPTGAFVTGGPKGDTGLTGRKIIVDTYGGWAPHGGGAFSGKDPSKVDRSAAYMARHIAKNVVAAGLADSCEVQLAYVIGVAEPASLRVRGEGWGREVPSDDVLVRAVRQVYRLTPAAIIRDLDLLRPIYRATAVGGHFGREEPEFTWERTDKAEALAEAGTGVRMGSAPMSEPKTTAKKAKGAAKAPGKAEAKAGGSPRPSCDVADHALAKRGAGRIAWAAGQMPVVEELARRFQKERTFQGVRIAACLHVTSETANLVRALVAGGADVVLCGSNPLSTQDDVAAALVAEGVAVHAVRGEDRDRYWRHIDAALAHRPHLTIDDGADLVSRLHETGAAKSSGVWGSLEETTTGVIRLRSMARDGALEIPVVAVNDAQCKHLFDNRYGTGQSTIDGIVRATNVLLAGRTVVVAGYGWCGKGVSMRARGLGANVVVTEIDPVKAIEASLDGHRVMPMAQAAPIGDVFVTVTGNRDVIRKEHFLAMQDGAIVCNSGHFDVEVDVKALEATAVRVDRHVRPALDTFFLPGERRIHLLAEGRLVNLAAAEGHPAAVMDMSFAVQALTAAFVVANRGKLETKVRAVPEYVDREVAALKLATMGLATDRLTKAQERYLASWREGT